MKFCIVIIAAVLGLARASPVGPRGCTSKDPKCWQDDGDGGWVWNDNPTYVGDNDQDYVSRQDDYEDLTPFRANVDPDGSDSEVPSLQQDNKVDVRQDGIDTDPSGCEPKIWRDDSYGGRVYTHNPNYEGDRLCNV